MLFRRPRHRRWIALIALLGLLFQQLAMAAYVCPMGKDGAAAVEAATPMKCHQGDQTDKVRCHAHCYPQAPSSDHAPPLTVPAALLPATTWWPAAAWRNEALDVGFERAIAAHAAAPPLTIQHCTFQI